jgi:hypothetical protein
MKRLTLSRLVIAMTFIALLAMAVRTPADTDMYWHLRTGQYILETRSVPAADPFSSTMLGKPWIDVHWLSQVILYATFAAFNTLGLALLVALLVVLAFVFVWKQMEGGVFLRAFILVLAAATAGVVWTPRSQMATFVFTALLGYLLYLYKWKQVDRLWLMPLMFVAWVNLHAGYVAGFMLLGTLMVGEALSNVALKFGMRGEPAIMAWARLRKLFFVTLLSGVVLVINPFTLNTLLLPLKTVNIGALQDFIQEWASPDFHELFQQPMIWMLLLTLAVIGWSGRRLDVTDALTLGLFAYISFLARRNIGLFALVCAPILSRHAAAWWAKSPGRDLHLSRGSPILNWIILILIVLAAAIKMIVPLLPATQTKAEADIVPVDAVNWIVEHRPTGAMFNSYNWGGYLLWRLWPDYPVYVDGRTDLYDNDFLRDDYLNIILARPGFQAKLDQRGIGFVIVEANSLLDTLLQQTARWREAYRDQMAVIYVRG